MPRRRRRPVARSASLTVIVDIPEVRRRAIFTALGNARATGQAPEVARYAVARKFVLTILRVEAIERDGLARGWAPRVIDDE
jgi:hypothetical protein